MHAGADCSRKSGMNDVRETFRTTTTMVDYRANVREASRLEAARRNALNNLTISMHKVNDLEAKPKYQETLRYLRKREFHLALDRVQAFVVQRLCEMSKAGMSGTGYKLRQSIWKALMTRGKAIRNALKAYKALAMKMDSPAPQLEWKEVVNYGFVSEFELPRHTYAAHEEVLSKFFKIEGARSELVRLNVKIH
ncbi:hypothetical protein QCA50_018057 [Cerrena zonata]|uniref:Uncharacterized protein n=1 Tax=Cerrena zonata TaxID=2478898 RepID=A0AAW0FHW1_9APHY